MDDLVARCREVLEWHRTGLLLQGGALHRLAGRLTNIPEIYRLSVAEKQTADEAMAAIVERDKAADAQDASIF